MNTPSLQTPTISDPAVQGPLQQEGTWREGFAQLLLMGALVLGLLTLAPTVFGSGSTLQIGLLIAFYVLMFVVAALRSPYWLRLICFLLLVYTLATADLRLTGMGAGPTFFFIALIVFATMLWSPWAGVVATAITLLTIAVGANLSGGAGAVTGTVAVPNTLLDWISIFATALLFGIAVVVAFGHLLGESRTSEKQVAGALKDLEAERGSLQARIESQNAQLRAVIEVGHAATAILDPGELTARVVNLISDRFGYYYAAIFLVNERGDQAELQSATGEAGRLLKETKHHLPVGGRSMVGRAISTRQARIALDTGAEPVRFDNPLLPYTRSEIALPLIVGDHVLGALDVQSTKPGAFGSTEIDILQGMANQVAIAFENARLFATSKQSLDDMQSIQRQYIKGAWNPLAQVEKFEYEVGDEEVPADSAALQVPLSLRDEIIGQINMASEYEWTPEQRNLVEAVATQAALALENARLLEASQSAARREHILAEITGQVWSSPTMDGILRTAVSELARALNADEASIELKMDQSHD